MSGKVALVTGSNGISKASALALVDNGYDKFVLGYRNNEQNANEVKKTLEGKGCTVFLVQGDLSTADGCEKMLQDFFESIKTNFDNQLDSFIHSAGCYLPKDEKAFDGYHFMYSKFYIEAIERSLALMKDGEGKIVSVSSPGCNLSYRPRSGYPAGAAKASLEYITRMSALREAERRININGVIPGVTNTSGWCLPEQAIAAIAQKSSPMKELIEPQTIGNVVAWLCSPSASAITGVMLPVDGGLHLT